ncbi:uncharacterized protein LOC119600595 isoform X1 [Lucilia sericata]|uniref:uncharacterized protein LOC119600595 isoform X1 n=1 Tax=Lucilia sericata TaxID=13632 RepID=UPI0018A7F133|nr:uncharacterized protein LOC119600595 isoform X1 [Lucilia sericata]
MNMYALGDFVTIRKNLSTAKRAVVVALHKLVFENEGDRQNRERLREFVGFDFTEEDEKFLEKTKYVKQNLSTADLVSICNILSLDYDVDDLFLHIFINMRKGNLLNSNDVDERDDGEDEISNEANVDDDDDDGEHTMVNMRNDVDDNAESDDAVVVEDERKMSKQTKNFNDGGSVGDKNNELLETKPCMRKYVNENKSNEKEQNKTYAVEQYNMSSFNTPRFSINFRDIEDSIRPLDGSGTIPIDGWINDFEETSAVMYWDEFQKYIFAKKSLRGLAKLFIASERGITTWIKLKQALIDEYKTTANSAQLHKMLTERKMNKDETIHEYFLKMKEMASRGNIEESALIQYVIDGIKDLTINKTILYGACNLKEFKEKLKCYETMQERSSKKVDTRTTNNNKTSAKNEKAILCYNCGEKGHTSRNCKDKEKGIKCFSCNKFGHISRECPVRVDKANVRQLAVENIMMVNVKLSDRMWMALFDTGSKFNVVTEKVYNSLNKPELFKSDFYLIGFGNTTNDRKIKPIGNFKTKVEVYGEEYVLTFHVVPFACIDVEIILGNEFCSFAEIGISPDGLKIKKIKDEIAEEVHSIMVMDVCADDNVNTLNIGETSSENAKREVIEMIHNYKPGKCKTTNIEMRIILKDEKPIFCNPRRLPIRERYIVDSQIEQWLDEGIIEPSESEFCSPIVLTKKKDSTPRLCIDFRRINKVIVKDRYPLPLIEDQLDRLQNAYIFSTIDLRNGFFHVPVNEESRKYTSFVTHNGQYQFKKVPFGLSNSPGVFQRHVNAIFRDLTREGIALPYIDDIIIPAKDEEEALLNLKRVLDISKDYGLDINIKKCNFLMKKIQFLGHVIENQHVSPSVEKTIAMVNYPAPMNVKQLERFLGLAGYFRKFIPNFSIIAKPLTDLKKQNAKFVFGHEQMTSFNTLKNVLSNGPVLSIFNQNYETEVHTDASIDGYGAVLLQKSPDDNLLHPVYYMSKKTTEQERKYTSYELEVLAVIEALKKFRVYLIGLKFRLVTDCNAFTKTLDKKDLCTRVARWILFLQEYDYIVEHRPGSQMRHVDALSRHPIMIIAEDSLISKIIRLQNQDEDLKIIREILKNKPSYNEYFLKGDVLYKMSDDYELLVIPKGMYAEIIKTAHEKGHFSIKKTKELIYKEYFIPKLEEKIQKLISNCIPCIINNRKRGRQEGELHPLSKEAIPLHTYHIDYLGPLESTNKMYNHIFAVIDSFTKFCWLYPTKTTSAKDAISRLQSQNVIFGNPLHIISDRGSAFTSEDFKTYCAEEKINHILITTGLPRANGQVERLNSVIISVLSKLSIDDPSKWYKFVGRVQQIINSTYHRSVDTTPFEMLIGTKMKTKDDIQLKELVEKELVADYDEQRNEIRRAAKQQLLEVQAENKRYYDIRRKPPRQYNVNDSVAIKRTQLGGGLKLRPKYLGPYQIVKVKQNDTYDVVKSSECEGPKRTTTCAEFMKPWPDEIEDEPDE